ncbi:MAG: restriction endonuclease subunit S [Cyclobacteriaceae bacterium]|nr:restriction endonuclease subunit S [Cyclobacteriaceae bacterium]
MRSNYKKIGDFIKLVDERNKGLKVDTLLGLTVNKVFIPSVANIVGTDMSNYKVIRKNQFACSLMQVRRDKKMPVALMNNFDEAIISQAYPVFEVNNKNDLIPEYLMMWFSRSEFDRHACFLAVGGVRGSLEWEDFLEMELPIPSIEKQRAIVKEYNTVVNRIKLNEQLNTKLEETAQALYKHWFVDFEFPNTEGKPYKSSGGKMVFNAELNKEIPEGWKNGELNSFIEVVSGFAFKSIDFMEYGNIPIIKIKNITPPTVSLDACQFFRGNLIGNLNKVKVGKGDVLISMTGSGANQMNSAVGQVGKYYHKKSALLNQRVGKLKLLKEESSEYVYQFIKNEDTHLELLNGSTGSANQANISPTQIKELEILIPVEEVLKNFHKVTKGINNAQRVESQDYLLELKDLILSKMTKVEVEKEVEV